MHEQPTGPLSGIRVLDLTRVVMGPFATQILADQGADVVMIEAATGDTNRVMGPGPAPQFSGVSLNLLRNKRSLALDLKDPGQSALVRGLVEDADVVVATMLPGTLRRLGLDYTAVREINPGVVYCQAQGWPLGSGAEDFPAYDDIIQSATGVGDMMDRVAGEPALLPTILADKVCALALAQAVTAALFHRARTGEGQHVEVPMVQAMTAFMLAEHGAGAIPEPPTPQGDLPPTGYPRVMTPERRPQRTADGWIQILPYHPQHFFAIFTDAGETQLLEDPRFADLASTIRNAAQLYPLMRDIVKRRTTGEWLDFCRSAGIPAVRMATLQDLVDDLPLAEHPVAGSYRVLPPTANFSATPANVRRPAPNVGEHTAQALDGGPVWDERSPV
ncbi:Acetyl-CoA:oxalate CoA-transferase [Streptomyces sp. RB5]|uniref:Acetyl-CoA:oxalate CoA-transferase n=1 Tax=Streptomyces smaragdinus TaxID=2585196 RepID=A0A7K0C9Z3_9ACTN|nr:CoA transferase [Streptomyces smaragdinus]MQY09952.1 Acetyl-CoA:oxalate CoA-transferase [Streptomyces smaragdinus]